MDLGMLVLVVATIFCFQKAFEKESK